MKNDFKAIRFDGIKVSDEFDERGTIYLTIHKIEYGLTFVDAKKIVELLSGIMDSYCEFHKCKKKFSLGFNSWVCKKCEKQEER